MVGWMNCGENKKKYVNECYKPIKDLEWALVCLDSCGITDYVFKVVNFGELGDYFYLHYNCDIVTERRFMLELNHIEIDEESFAEWAQWAEDYYYNQKPAMGLW